MRNAPRSEKQVQFLSYRVHSIQSFVPTAGIYLWVRKALDYFL